jgi:pimeloyl-ACP methyl ester carboxylesterase
VRLRLVFAGSLLAVVAAAPARAAVQFAPCAATSKVECGTIDVPLDPSGGVPGTAHLSITRYAPTATPRGVVLFIAGGPGQSSAGILRAKADARSSLLEAYAGYTIVAVDQRGTGGSGVVACDFSNGSDADASLACLQRFGAAGRFVSTRANAADLEAVRQAVGAPRVVVSGTSYGTFLADAYARLYPASVERLVLDSVRPLGHPDPFSTASLRAIPRVLDALCAGRCPPGLGEELVGVANKLPVPGVQWAVNDGAGRAHAVEVSRDVLLQIAYATDLDLGLTAALPGAIRAYEQGDVAPLARLVGIGEGLAIGRAESPYGEERSAYVLTTCNDLQAPPWAPELPLAQRPQAVVDASNALPASALGGFGPWAARSSFPSICLDWDVPPEAATLAGLPAPDVPVLALAGSLDVRTPVEDAQAAVAAYPRGRLLVLPGLGHSVLTSSACARRAVAAWLSDPAAPLGCAAVPPALPFVPTPSARVPRTHTEIRHAVDATVADAAGYLYMSTLEAYGGALSLGGLRSGRIRLSASRFSVTLADDEFARGVYVSGFVASFGFENGRARLVGTVSGCGPGKTHFKGTVHGDGTTRLTFVKSTKAPRTKACP